MTKENIDLASFKKSVLYEIESYNRFILAHNERLSSDLYVKLVNMFDVLSLLGVVDYETFRIIRDELISALMMRITIEQDTFLYRWVKN